MFACDRLRRANCIRAQQGGGGGDGGDGRCSGANVGVRKLGGGGVVDDGGLAAHAQIRARARSQLAS